MRLVCAWYPPKWSIINETSAIKHIIAWEHVFWVAVCDELTRRATCERVAESRKKLTHKRENILPHRPK